MTDRRDREKQELCDNIHWTWDTIGREKSMRVSIQMQLGHIDRQMVWVEKEIGRLSLELERMEKKARLEEREKREAREETEGWIKRSDTAIRRLLEVESEQDRKINQLENELRQEIAKRGDYLRNLDSKINSLSEEVEKKCSCLEESFKVSRKESDKIMKEEISFLKEENETLRRGMETQRVKNEESIDVVVGISKEQMQYLELSISSLRDSIANISEENVGYRDRIVRVERAIAKKRDEDLIESLKREVERLKSEQTAGLSAVQSCVKLIYEVINKKIDLHDTNLIYHINKMYHLNSK